jgi:hypothetical protein
LVKEVTRAFIVVFEVEHGRCVSRTLFAENSPSCRLDTGRVSCDAIIKSLLQNFVSHHLDFLAVEKSSSKGFE